MAAAPFDPYYTWLGIPPRDQPPNHYRLLGIELFESNPDVIDHAANRQMAHLRSCSVGARAHFAQEILNQVAAARICLLDRNRKAEYDAKLQSLPPLNSTPPRSFPPEPLLLSEFTLPASPPSSRRTVSTSQKNSKIEILKVVFGGLAGLAIGFVILLMFFPEAIRRTPKTAQQAKSLRTEDPQTKSAATSSTKESNSQHPPLESVSTGSNEAIPATPSEPASVTAVQTPSIDSKPPTSSTPQLRPEKSALKKKNGKNPNQPPSRSPNPTPAPSQSSPRDLGELASPAKSTVSSSAEQFPAGVTLPPAEVSTWQTLLPLSQEPKSIELIPAFDPVASKMTLTMQVIDECGERSWRVQYELVEETSAGKQGTLAELSIEPTSSDLQFRWLTVNLETAAALSNSWLKFELNAGAQYLSLRQSAAVSALKLEFEKSRFVIPLAINSVPITDQLFLVLESVSSVPRGCSIRNGLSESTLDRELVLEFSEMPGAEIGIKLAKVPQSPLGLIVEPRFKDGPSREFDLTFTQLEKTERGAAGGLQEAKAKLPGLTTNLSNAQSALRSAQNRAVANNNQANQRLIDIARMEGLVRDASKRLNAMREQEAVAQTRLQNVPRVLSFLKSLNGVQIPFQVIVKGGPAKMVLAKGT